MKAAETTVRSLLQGEKQYVIPLYQRTYSWRRDNFQQLWDDLIDLTQTGNSEVHFLGSVVLAPSPNNTAAGVQSWLVVDGQQRMTTLSILLCAIRDYVAKEDPRLSEKIDDLYLINKYAEGDGRYKLLPTQLDRPSWTSLVEDKPGKDGEDNIGEAYRFFTQRLQEKDDPEDPHDIAALESAITGQLGIVEIAAHPGDNVHRIFESLNHTGQPLRQVDLLRNYLFMRLPARGDHIYQNLWEPLQGLLSADQLEELIWLDLVIRGDDKATQNSVFRQQQRVLNAFTGEGAIEYWIKELYQEAIFFRRVADPSYEPSLELRKALQRLRRWGAQIVNPIALHVLMEHDRGTISASEGANALRVVESYLVRRMLVGLASTGTNRILMSLVRELEGTPPTPRKLTFLLSQPRKRFPDDDNVRTAVLEQPFYWRGRPNQRAAVLRALEEDLEHKEPVNFEKARLQIEHILPQTLTPDWREVLKAECSGDETVEEVQKSVVHTLGNLTLTGYNARLSNQRFDQKRTEFSKSGLALNNSIVESATWGRGAIQSRGEALTDRIVRIWPGPDTSTLSAGEAVAPQWTALNSVLAAIPAGRWTSYSEVGEVIGVHQVPVGNRLATAPAPNAHRVLRRTGEVSSSFQWLDRSREDRPEDILKAEGVKFDERGRADQSQRMNATELALAAGMELESSTDLGEDEAVETA